MKRRPLIPYVYSALFEISSLREQLHGLSADLGAEEAARFTSRLQRLESDALHLIDNVESRRPTTSH
jgi:hypothetical protein